MEIKVLLRVLTVMFALISLHECFDDAVCPEPKAECDRDLRDFYERVNVYSSKYNKSFMCDTKTDGGGWIIIQRRIDRDTSFNRDWKSYKFGFGQVCSDYWLGNDYIHYITSKGLWELRIDMVYRHKPRYALYVESDNTNYRMHYKKFVDGNTLDMMKQHNGKQFSTPEKDNTDGRKGCAKKYSAGWWYGGCHTANLNGNFHDNRYGHGVIWEILTTDFDSLESVEMKIRPMLRKMKKSQ